MGACASKEVKANQSDVRIPYKKTELATTSVTLDSSCTFGPACDGACQHHPPEPARHATVNDTRGSEEVQDVAKSYELLQQIALLSTNPLMALQEAVDLIVQCSRAELVGISVFVDGDPGCAVWLVAYGEGAPALDQHVPMRGAAWSATLVQHTEMGRLTVGDAAEQAGDLPRDLGKLHTVAGLRSFEVLLVGPRGGRPCGTLLLGKSAPNGFSAEGRACSPCLSVARSWLMQVLRQTPVQQMATLQRAIGEAADPVAAISALLQGAARFVWVTTNTSMNIRLALLQEGDSVLEEPALVFEQGHAVHSSSGGYESWLGNTPNSRSSGPWGLSGVPYEALESGVVVRQMDTDGTLLANAVSLKKAWSVRDTTLYMQNTGRPARDLFASRSSHSPVKSVAVVPLMLRDRPFGAIYFCCSVKVDFENIRDMLLAMVPFVGLTLSNKLQGGMDHLRSLVAEVRQGKRCCNGAPPNMPTSTLVPIMEPVVAGRPSITPDGTAARPAPDRNRVSAGSGGAGGSDSDSSASEDFEGLRHDDVVVPGPVCGAGGAAAAAAAAAFARQGAAGSGQSSSLGKDAWREEHDEANTLSCRLSIADDRRLSTESMMKSLQREIRRGHRGSMELSFMSDLALHREIGRGGFGVVYMGTWRKLPAAIKIMNACGDDGEAMSDAMEMAVLSSVQHPNIVQLYACLMDMLELDPGDDCAMVSTSGLMEWEGTHSASPDPPPLPRYRQLLPGEEGLRQTFNIAVLEYCDFGTLRQAIHQGVFHTLVQGPAPGMRVDVVSIIDVLLDVSTALQYLHDSVTLVHGDVKLDNILLKRDPSRTLGFTPKLSDFGLTKLLSPEDPYGIINRRAAGTVTHMAPELFTAGTQITPAVDVYAFGIMMWEMFTGRRAYDGMSRDAITAGVMQGGLRPAFPAGTPPGYSRLASCCWAAPPAGRLAFAEVMVALRMLRADLAQPVAAEQSERAAPRRSVAGLLRASPQPAHLVEPAGAPDPRHASC